MVKRLILISCIIVILLSACGTNQNAAPPSLETADAQSTTSSSPDNIRANGILLPVREVTLSFGSSGPIESLKVQIGDEVTEGQELARLVSTLTVKEKLVDVLQEIVESNKAVTETRSLLYYLYVPPVLADLESLEALKLANVMLSQAQTTYEPCKQLSHQDKVCKYKKEQLGNAQGIYKAAIRQIEYKTALLSAEVRLEKAEQEYAKLRNASSEGLVYSDEIIITAPFNGTVSSVYLNQHERAAPGQAVIELQDVSRWHIETKNVGELVIGRVILGQKVKAIVNTFQDTPLTGYVIEIEPEAVVQQGDVTYTLIIELDSTDLNLRPGMTVQVEIMVNSE